MKLNAKEYGQYPLKDNRGNPPIALTNFVRDMRSCFFGNIGLGWFSNAELTFRGRSRSSILSHMIYDLRHTASYSSKTAHSSYATYIWRTCFPHRHFAKIFDTTKQDNPTIDYKVMRKCDNMSSCLTRLTSATVGQTNYASTAYIVRQWRLAKAVLCTGKLVHKQIRLQNCVTV